MFAVSSRSLARTLLFAATIAVALLAFTAAQSSAAYTITDFQLTPSPSPILAGGHSKTHYHVDPDANAAGSDDLKKVVVDFPAGLLGNPEAATPKCVASGTGSANKFTSDACPASSYIGSMLIKWKEPLGNLTSAPGSVYLLSPATAGSAATIGFIVRPQGWRKIFLKTEVGGIVTVRSGTEADYGLTLTVDNIPRVLTSSLGLTYPITLSDIAVDINARAGGTNINSPNGKFFTFNPTRCDAATTRATITSYANVNITKTSSFSATDCAGVGFNPTASVAPTVTTPGAATGVNATFGIPTADADRQQSHVRNIQVDLPNGTGLNFPAIGAVPALCAEASLNADACPAGSKIGTVSAVVPFLPPTMTGDVYLLTRNSSITFGYILRGANGVKAPLKGSVAAVDIDADGESDRIRAIATTMPQVPWTSATISFTSKLINNPPACSGPSIATSTLNGWSGATATRTNNWSIGSASCAPDTTITSGPTGYVGSTSASFAFTSSIAGSTFQCSLDGGAYTACVSPANYTGLPQTAHTFCVRAIAGGLTDTTPACRSWTVDTTPPVITITAPVPPLPAGQTSTVLVYTVVDNSGQVPTCDKPSPSTIPLAIGANTISVTCVDAAGNAASASITLTVPPPQPPVINITTPANNSITNAASVTVNYTVTPGTSVCNRASGSSQALVEGANTISVVCVNPNGGASATATVVVIRDTVAPVVTLTCNVFDDAATAQCPWSVNDPTASVTCTRDGAALPTPCPNPIPVSGPGAHTVSVTATDTAGNASTASRSFTIAPPPLSMVITSPVNGSATTNATVNVSYTVAGYGTFPTTIVCRINGVPSTSTTTNSVALVPGANTIVLVCTDAAGSSSTATVVITRITADTTAPTISGLASSQGSGGVTITYNATDNSGVAPTCTPPSGTKFPFNSTGSFMVTVVCRDAAGNTASDSLNITHWGAGDGLIATISGGPNGNTTSTSPVFTYTVNRATSGPLPCPAGQTCAPVTVPLIKFSCTVDGVAATCGEGTYTAPSLPLGQHTFCVTARGIYSGETSPPACRSFTVINSGGTPPVVTMTSPTGGSYIGVGTFNVSYQVNGSAAIPADTTCTVNGVASTSATTNATALEPGTNAIRVSCSNASGTDTKVVTMTRYPAFMVVITTPAPNSYTTSSVVNVTYNRINVDYVSVTCTINGNPSTSGSVNPVAIPMGTSTIDLVCRSGNDVSKSSISITRGNPPAVAITAPANNSSASGTTNVSYTVDGSASIPAGTNCHINGASSTNAATNTVALAGGANLISVACTNIYGSSVATITVTGDSPTLSLAITSPPDGSTTPNPAVNVTYSVAGVGTFPGSITCQINGVNSTSTTTNTVPLNLGPNTITLTCTDVDGNSSTASISVTRVDTTPPTIGTITITPLTPTTARITYTATDNSGVAPSCTPASGSIVPIASTGSTTITVSCVDGSGNSASASRTYYNPGGGPLTVTITGGPPSTTDDSTPTFTYVTNQPTSGQLPCPPGQTCIALVVDLISFSCSMDGNTVPCGPGSYTSPGVTPGQHTFCVSAHGIYNGQNSNVACQTFTYVPIGTNVPPVVTITAPASGSSVTGPNATVTWVVTGSAPLACTVNGSVATSPASVPLSIGLNTIAVTCTNPYGSNTSTVNVTYMPSATFAPTFNQTLSSTQDRSKTTLTWSMTNPAGAEGIRRIRVFQDPALAPNFAAFGSSPDMCAVGASSTSFDVSTCPTQARFGTVSFTSSNYPGTITGRLYLIGYAAIPRYGIDVNPSIPGNPSGLSFQTVIQTSVPQVDPLCDPFEDECPTQQVMFAQDLPNIGLTSITAQFGGIARTGVYGPLDSEPFIISATQCAAGSSLATTAQFTGWSASTATVTDNDPITCAPTPPQGPSIVITNPTSQWTQSSSVAFTYTVSPGSGDTPTCSIASGTIVPLNDGPNTITVTCSNSTGTVTRSAQITRDNQAPTITITSPILGSVTSSGSVFFSYTVTDNWDPSPICTPAPGPITLTTQGPITFTVTCTDHAGNSATKSVTIVRDSIAPTVTVNCAPGGSTANCTFVSSEPGSATCRVNGGAVTACTSPFVASPIFIDGVNTILVCVTDAAGNTGCGSTTVGDPFPPQAAITQYAPPSTTSTSNPIVTFSAASAECRVDSGAFTPCTSPWTIPTASLSSPAEHTYEIRAGGQVTAPARGYIWVDNRAYNATATVTPQANTLTSAAAASTAGAHPDISAAINVESAEDTRNVSIQFPDGLMGSLRSVPVASRCTSAQATAGTCPASSQVGTITGNMVFANGGTTTASGAVYMVDSAGLSSQYAAGAAISVKNIPGGHGDINALGKLSIVDNGRALKLEATDVPRETTLNHRFHLLNGTVTIKGDTGGVADPLITNPHFCGTPNVNRPGATRFTGSGTSYNGLNTPTITAPYSVTGCAGLPFNPTLNSSFTSLEAGTLTTMTTTVSMPSENSTLRQAIVRLPSFVSPNLPSFGDYSDQCPAGPFAGGGSIISSPHAYLSQTFNEFTPVNCPAQARAGVATITSPLVQGTLTADVWFVNKSPIPNLGISVDPTKYGNPQGVKIGLYGTTSTPQVDPACDPLETECPTQITAQFSSIPDVPVSSMSLTMGGVTGRTSGYGGTSLDSQVLSIAGANDTACVSAGTYLVGSFYSWSAPTVAVTRNNLIVPTGCNQ